jgi:arylsulfatase
MDILTDERPSPFEAEGSYRFYPGTSDLPEHAAPNLRGRSFKVLATVEITDADAEGVLFSHGARFGGHTLFLKDRKLWYVNNFLGIPPEQQVVSSREVGTGEHVLGASFDVDHLGERKEAIGTATLYIDDEAVGTSDWRTQPGHFALCGEGLGIGRDSADPVSKEYGPGYAFRGGTIRFVDVAAGDAPYLDLETQALAMLARE